MPADAEPRDAVTAILELFEQVPLVALGEMHGVEQGARLIEALVQHPRFASVANAIVVEFGNALYQDVVDRYVAGATVDRRELRRTWEDLSGAAPWGFRKPIYEQFFATMRAVNRALPPSRHVRVLLGDPALDWQAVRAPEPVHSALGARDAHFAGVVGREVLGRGHRALLLAGDLHLVRVPAFGPPRVPVAPRMLMQMLDADHPGTTYVIVPHHLATIEPRLASWPVPGFAAVRGTWLGELSAERVYGGLHMELVTADGVVTTPYAGTSLGLEDLADGYLYLGPTAAYTWSHWDPDTLDEADRAELERRIELMTPPDACQS